MTTHDGWLSISEACAVIGISLRTGRTYARRDGYLDRDQRIPVYRFGPRCYRVPGWALDGRTSYADDLTTDGSSRVDETRLDPMEHGQEQ